MPKQLDNRKLYVARAAKKCYMTEATRNRFHLNTLDTVALKNGDRQTTMIVRQAPLTVARLLGQLELNCLVFLDKFTMDQLGVQPGDQVGLSKPDRGFQSQRTATSKVSGGVDLERCQKAYDLKASGKTCREIQAIMGIGESEVYRKIKIYREHIGK